MKWKNGFQLSAEDAAFVRKLRVDEECTWRMVALRCAAAWGGDWGSNQLAGRDLCDSAADVLGEDAGKEPWN